MKKLISLTLLVFAVLALVFAVLVHGRAQSILIEAESFLNKGGWVVDPQFVEQMGSPYLLAHGMGIPVKDAETKVSVKKTGLYHIWARTKNWAPGPWDAPGRFNISVDGTVLEKTLGNNPGWNWEYAGSINLTKGDKALSLKDLTGFDGRCDAIYFTIAESEKLPVDMKELKKWRLQQLGIDEKPNKILKYDLVVVGGGIAGCAASIAAAEQGLKVALVQDRPVLGGNSSNEIRVNTLGILGKFERILKMIVVEHGFMTGASTDIKEADQIRLASVEKYENIKIWLNYRAFDAKAENGKIAFVDARHTSTGEAIRFKAPLFVDCTGDGWIGYWAGAEYAYGREVSSKYNESWDKYGTLWSPDTPDNRVMGSSIMWSSKNAGKPVVFPKVPWAMEVAKDYAKKGGGWTWEFSSNDLHQIDDGEIIRDHLLQAIYGSFYNFKQLPGSDSIELKWVSSLLGKRESRRLMGDYVYTFNDERESRQFEDAVVFAERDIDVHFMTNLRDPGNPDFISGAMFYKVKPYSVPYRSLYSRNIVNLFMAGRNFSCSHVALGGPRVMYTTGQMGAAVGLAASLCKKYNTNPRDIYKSHLKEYLDLIESQK